MTTPTRRYKSIQPSFNTTNSHSPSSSTSRTAVEEQQQEEEISEIVNYPSSSSSLSHSTNVNQKRQQQLVEEQPVLLNSKQHVVGYLNRILNARVYEAAIETQLQHAKSLSTVRII